MTTKAVIHEETRVIIALTIDPDYQITPGLILVDVPDEFTTPAPELQVDGESNPSKHWWKLNPDNATVSDPTRSEVLAAGFDETLNAEARVQAEQDLITALNLAINDNQTSAENKAVFRALLAQRQQQQQQQ